MSSLAYSQNGFPKKVIVNNQTVVAITEEHLKEINLKALELQECNEIKEALFDKITKDSALIVAQNEYNESLLKEVDLNKSLLNNYKTINSELNKDLQKATKLYNKERLRVGILGGTSVVLIGTIVTLLLIN